jgi:GxxExxY protein
MLSGRVIGCAIEVSKQLGSGYLEAVYEQALALEMQSCGIRFERQKRWNVIKRMARGANAVTI